MSFGSADSREEGELHSFEDQPAELHEEQEPEVEDPNYVNFSHLRPKEGRIY